MTIKGFSLVLLFVGIFVVPKSFSSDIPENNVKLSLTPLACFVKNIGDVCHLTIKVNWQSQVPIQACLFQNNEKMHCWQDTKNASKRIEISLSENMKFTLLGDNNEIYAQQHVSISASTSKKYRRRLRADWSLFKCSTFYW